MKELSLFSGAGGGLLGTKLLGWEHCGYVEFSDYCQRVIAQRIEDGFLDEAPIFSDIRAFLDEGYADAYQGMVDVVTAGFPCQPFSVAGKRAGGDDSRNLWPETLAVLRAVRPRYALLENVPGLLAHKYARRIFGDLAENGFDAQWRVLSAAECGAPHKRDRIWIYAANSKRTERRRRADRVADNQGRRRAQSERASVQPQDREAYADDAQQICEALADTHDTNGRRRTQQSQSRDREPGIHGKDREAVADIAIKSQRKSSDQADPESISGKARSVVGSRSQLADSERIRLEGQQQSRAAERTIDRPSHGSNPRWWATEPDVGRVADGVASRVDRLKALGNGQVPAVAATAWNLLRGATR